MTHLLFISLSDKKGLGGCTNSQTASAQHIVCTMDICPGSFVFVFIFVSVFVSVFALFVFSLETGGQGVYSQVQWGSCVRRGDSSH